jgi:hypothetical protein
VAIGDLVASHKGFDNGLDVLEKGIGVAREIRLFVKFSHGTLEVGFMVVLPALGKAPLGLCPGRRGLVHEFQNVQLMVLSVRILVIGLVSMGGGPPEGLPKLFKGEGTDFGVLGYRHSLEEVFQIGGVGYNVFPPHKLDKRERVSTTNQENFEGSLCVRPGYVDRGLAEQFPGRVGVAFVLYGNDSVTCNGMGAGSK